MAICRRCRTEVPDYYPECPNCGGPLAQRTAPQPPPIVPQPMPKKVMKGEPQSRTVTSPLCWLGWELLCLLPIVGPIIMLCSSNDNTAKNYAKAKLILTLISAVLIAFCTIIAFYYIVEIFKSIHLQ